MISKTEYEEFVKKIVENDVISSMSKSKYNPGTYKEAQTNAAKLSLHKFKEIFDIERSYNENVINVINGDNIELFKKNLINTIKTDVKKILWDCYRSLFPPLSYKTNGKKHGFRDAYFENKDLYKGSPCDIHKKMLINKSDKKKKEYIKIKKIIEWRKESEFKKKIYRLGRKVHLETYGASLYAYESNQEIMDMGYERWNQQNCK